MKLVVHLSLLVIIGNFISKVNAQNSYLGIQSGFGTWNFLIRPAGILNPDNEAVIPSSTQPFLFNMGIHYSIESDSSPVRLEFQLNHKHTYHKSLHTNQLHLSSGIRINLITIENITVLFGTGAYLSTILNKLGTLENINNYKMRQYTFGYYFSGGLGTNVSKSNSIDIRYLYNADISTSILTDIGSKYQKKYWTDSIGLNIVFIHKIHSN